MISNDDGMGYGGIHALIDVARRIGDVVVVAPAHHQSGMASAITCTSPLRAAKVTSEPGYEVWHVTGTPTDCVKLAIDHLLEGRRPTIVLSGINHGYNAGVSTMYSGTMGVVFEAAVHGVPAIAFSHGQYSQDIDFEPCKPLIESIVRLALQRGLPKGVCLNVNFPREGHDFKGIRVTTTAMGYWDQEYEHRVDPHGFDYYWLTGRYVCDDPDDDTTDMYWLPRGWVTVTPCHVDQTDHKSMSEIAELLAHL